MREFLFRYRGYTMAPFGFFLLIFGKPDIESFFLGLGLCVLGELLRIWGVGYAGASTRKSYLEAKKLITAGPFRYVRHPLYLGNALIGLGGTIMAVGRYSGGSRGIFFLIWLIFYGSVYASLISLEEEFLKKEFGEVYLQYRQTVPPILPTFISFPAPSGKYDWNKAWSTEIHTLAPLLAVILIMFIKIHLSFPLP